MFKLKIIPALFINVFFLITIPFGSIGQDLDSTISKAPSQYYRTLSVGLNRPIYRDFATSPLFYNGFGLNLQTSWLVRNRRKERSLDIGLIGNIVSARIPKSNFLQPSTDAIFGQINVKYLMLWELKRFSSERNNIKMGGIFYNSQNIRVNPYLSNNSLGLERLTNLMVSGQIIRDVSRKSERKLNLWLFKPTLNPKKREIRFQLSAGLLNLNNRPGYSYIYVDEIVGLETNMGRWQLSDYKWSINGWRFSTELELINYLSNGNARSLSYVWDAANAPGRYETFQMASHQIRFAYYFHRKSK